VEEGEAMDLLYALRWIKELQINNVTFNLDPKRIADSLSALEVMNIILVLS